MNLRKKFMSIHVLMVMSIATTPVLLSPNTPCFAMWNLAEEPEPAPEEKACAARKPPTPPGAKELKEKRMAMVSGQIETASARAWDGRKLIKDQAVLTAMRAVPRHVFVPAKLRSRAYADTPLPIGHGQTISQPYIVALMTELLELKPDMKVLEIGTGSGYQAAVLAHLTPQVYTIEIIKPLALQSEKVLREQGYTEVHCRNADGYFGWKEVALFDAIIVTCAAGHLPPPLWEQLKPGGRMVIPIGGPYEVQRLVVITKTAEGKRRSRTETMVRFVPLTRPASDQAEEDPASSEK